MTKMTEETRAFTAETAKVLQLMIHSLYTNRDIFLRELISNASDACDKRRYLSLTNPEYAGEEQPLMIRIEVHPKDRTLVIADSGIGMSRDEMIANLGTIAKSGTQDFMGSLTGDGAKDLPLIGQFGVGFYSSFMVADKVTVESRKPGETKGHAWVSDGLGEFTVTEAVHEVKPGTRITLHLKPDADAYLDKFRILHIVQTYSDHISFPIEFVDEEGKAETVNTGSALWARPKAEITQEQYKEFYNHVAHSPDDPWMTLHNKAEGKIEYTNLLYIPSIRPFDLFHPDRRRRVKLYVKRVFITDEGVDLVPHYLRFLQGVVDSEDLPLNISRENLQHNPLLVKIRESIVKRVLGELKKRAEKDAEDYKSFWKNFGSALKEGLCEATSPKEQILEVCRFHSTQGDAQISLDDYISRMKEKQDTIYYLAGERLETVRKSPRLEGFTKRGIEVLLFTDHVDDFWVNAVRDYKGKPFQSVTRASIDLDTIAPLPEETKESEKSKDDASQIDGLIALLKTTLGGEIKDVRTTAKLADSPVCLAVDEGAMDIRLERFLVENKQLPQRSAKILEVNPHHPIIRALADRAAAGSKSELEDIAWLLLDQARILEGEEVTDPSAFTRRMNGFLTRSLAA